MGTYRTDVDTALTLDDGRVIAKGATFEAELRPEQEAHWIACGAIVKPDVVSDSPAPVVLAGVVPIVDLHPSVGPETTVHAQAAGDPAKE